MQLKQANILIVDDDKDVLTAVHLLLKPEVKSITVESDPENLRRPFAANSFDILFLDMNFTSTLHTGRYTG